MDSKPSPNEPSVPQAASTARSNKRPHSVTLLALGVLIITVINLTRLVLSIRYWGFLNSLPAVSPFYLAITGLIWTVAGSFLLWGLWSAKIWAPRLMQAIALTYALYYWMDLIFLQDHPVSGAAAAIRMVLPDNWQFSAGMTVLYLAFMVWTLGRSKAKAYFGQVEPKTDQNQVNEDDPG